MIFLWLQMMPRKPGGPHKGASGFGSVASFLSLLHVQPNCWALLAHRLNLIIHRTSNDAALRSYYPPRQIQLMKNRLNANVHTKKFVFFMGPGSFNIGPYMAIVYSFILGCSCFFLGFRLFFLVFPVVISWLIIGLMFWHNANWFLAHLLASRRQAVWAPTARLAEPNPPVQELHRQPWDNC